MDKSQLACMKNIEHYAGQIENPLKPHRLSQHYGIEGFKESSSLVPPLCRERRHKKNLHSLRVFIIGNIFPFVYWVYLIQGHLFNYAAYSTQGLLTIYSRKKTEIVNITQF